MCKNHLLLSMCDAAASCSQVQFFRVEVRPSATQRPPSCTASTATDFASLLHFLVPTRLPHNGSHRADAQLAMHKIWHSSMLCTWQCQEGRSMAEQKRLVCIQPVALAPIWLAVVANSHLVRPLMCVAVHMFCRPLCALGAWHMWSRPWAMRVSGVWPHHQCMEWACKEVSC